MKAVKSDQMQKPASYTRVQCAFCESEKMSEIIDFGEVALAGGFLKKESFADEPRFRLRLFFCQSCYAVQVVDVVDPNHLFRNYFYFSSAIRTLREHFFDYAMEVSSRFLEPERATVVEIGCNDGILLKPFAQQNVRTIVGVDPAANIISTIEDKKIHTIADFFTTDVARRIENEHGKADLIVANNVYAHIPDIRGTTDAIHSLLKDDGVFVFEVHYLGKVIEGLQYDMVYHEHLYYYSLISLLKHFDRFGMTIFDVKPIPIHAGSMRYYVAKNSSRHARNVSRRVSMLEEDELARGYDKKSTYARFASDVNERKERLMDLLTKIKRKGRSIAGYGASGRANTIIQYCGIDTTHLDYIVDDAPAKEGFYTPGSHFLIRSNQALREDPPDYLLIFAWGYLNEIAEKARDYMDNGGRMITPLPDVKVIFVPGDESQI